MLRHNPSPRLVDLRDLGELTIERWPRALNAQPPGAYRVGTLVLNIRVEIR